MLLFYISFVNTDEDKPDHQHLPQGHLIHQDLVDQGEQRWDVRESLSVGQRQPPPGFLRCYVIYNQASAVYVHWSSFQKLIFGILLFAYSLGSEHSSIIESGCLLGELERKPISAQKAILPYEENCPLPLNPLNPDETFSLFSVFFLFYLQFE